VANLKLIISPCNGTMPEHGAQTPRDGEAAFFLALASPYRSDATSVNPVAAKLGCMLVFFAYRPSTVQTFNRPARSRQRQIAAGGFLRPPSKF